MSNQQMLEKGNKYMAKAGTYSPSKSEEIRQQRKNNQPTFLRIEKTDWEKAFPKK